MALFTVSKPKPECSRSNRTKSQPADLRIWPIPGVANSTMKCPSFACREPAIAFRPFSVMPILLLRVPLSCGARLSVSGRWTLLADEVAVDHRFVGDERRTFPVEFVEMGRLHMRLECGLVLVHLIEKDTIGLLPALEDVEMPAAPFRLGRNPCVS